MPWAQGCAGTVIRTSPPHSLQFSMSILNTRLRRMAQLMEARFSAAVWSSSSEALGLLPLPRPAGVTTARYLLLGAPKVGALGEYTVKAG